MQGSHLVAFKQVAVVKGGSAKHHLRIRKRAVTNRRKPRFQLFDPRGGFFLLSVDLALKLNLLEKNQVQRTPWCGHQDGATGLRWLFQNERRQFRALAVAYKKNIA